MIALFHFGKLEDRVDQAGSATRWEMSGLRVQFGTGGSTSMGRCVHVGKRDNVSAIVDLDVLVLLLIGHGGLQERFRGRQPRLWPERATRV
jgi:hypothetical protein